MKFTLIFFSVLISFAALRPIFEFRAAKTAHVQVMKTFNIEEMTKHDWQSLDVKIDDETIDEILRRKNSVDDPLTRESFLGSYKWDNKRFLKIGFRKWKQLCGGSDPKYEFKLRGKVIPWISSSTLGDRYRKGQPLLETARVKRDYSITRQTLPPPLQQATPVPARPSAYRPFFNGGSFTFGRKSRPYTPRFAGYTRQTNQIPNPPTKASTAAPITPVLQRNLPKIPLPPYQKRLRDAEPLTLIGNSINPSSLISVARDTEPVKSSIPTPTFSGSATVFSCDDIAPRDDTEDVNMQTDDANVSFHLDSRASAVKSTNQLAEDMEIEARNVINKEHIMAGDGDSAPFSKDNRSMIATQMWIPVHQVMIFFVILHITLITSRSRAMLFLRSRDHSILQIANFAFAHRSFLWVVFSLFKVVLAACMFVAFSFCLKHLKSSISVINP